MSWGTWTLGGGATEEGRVAARSELGVCGGEFGGSEQLHRRRGGEARPVPVGMGGLIVGARFSFGGVKQFETAEAAEGDGKLRAGGDLRSERFELPEGFAMQVLEGAVGQGAGGPEGAQEAARNDAALGHRRGLQRVRPVRPAAANLQAHEKAHDSPTPTIKIFMAVSGFEFQVEIMAKYIDPMTLSTYQVSHFPAS